MGLDVYLYRYVNKKETEEREQKYEDYSTKLWSEVGDYEKLTENQKDELNKKLREYAKSLGLNEWGSDELTKFQVEEDSKKYPEHMFKVGYFRSSYNGAGINRILSNMGLPTLDDIFEVDGQYHVKPNWKKALENVDFVLAELYSKPAYRVEAISGNIFRETSVRSEAQALQIFLNQSNDKNNLQHNYSSAEGHFYFSEPVKVLALIPGKQTILGERDCTYMVTESDNKWYIESLEIVKETIEYVINSEMEEQYYLHWSG